MSELKTMSHRKIGGISLINTGLRGIEIIYETVEIISGVSYDSEDKKKSFRPVHRELKGYVKELGKHLCVLSGHDVSQLVDFEVVSIKAGSDRFLISGKLRCWGDKIVAVNTPLIKEVDEYEEYDKVMELVDNIYKETDLYLRGVKQMKREDVIIDYMKDVKKRVEFVPGDFESMTPEEMEEFFSDINKDLGIVVKMEGGKMVIDSSEEKEEEGALPGVSGISTEDEIKSTMTAVVDEKEENVDLMDEVDLDIDLPL